MTQIIWQVTQTQRNKDAEWQGVAEEKTESLRLGGLIGGDGVCQPSL